MADLFFVLSYELSKLGLKRVTCLCDLGFEPRSTDVKVFSIFYLLQKNSRIFTSRKAQKRASINFDFIIDVLCTVRLCVINLMTFCFLWRDSP